MISRRRLISYILNYTLLIVLGIVIIYPFFWLIGSSFKTSTEIFSDPSFIPKDPTIDGYINGWKGAGLTSFGTFFKNTYIYVVLKVVFTVVSATLTAYGFSRFEFRGRKALQSILIATLLFPDSRSRSDVCHIQQAGMGRLIPADARSVDFCGRYIFRISADVFLPLSAERYG